MPDLPDLAFRTSAVERFLRYVQVDTQSREGVETAPSTPGQWDLLRMLRDEMEELGLHDVHLSEHGVLTATIPASRGREDAPAIGWIAHVDTSPEMPGAGVRPLVHQRYDGRDLALPDDPAQVIRVAENPELERFVGWNVITASGATLLGADDKAGVAEIMGAAEYLMAHPEAPRGPVRIAMTPDEEVGRGTEHFDVEAFGAVYAYTLDGQNLGELQTESFSADTLTLIFQGFNTHPGYGKGRLVNAIKLASAFVERLPRDRLSPETTEGHEGYVHPYVIQGGVDETRVRCLVRDFRTEGLREKEAQLQRWAREAVEGIPRASVTWELEESYRNMREVLDRHPDGVERAREAIRRAGLEVRETPIRGGTDGSMLSWKGLPTPNLFAGQHNFHSRLEWTTDYEIHKAVEVLVRLAALWAEVSDEGEDAR